jgi:hypothetical protein
MHLLKGVCSALLPIPINAISSIQCAQSYRDTLLWLTVGGMASKNVHAKVCKAGQDDRELGGLIVPGRRVEIGTTAHQRGQFEQAHA